MLIDFDVLVPFLQGRPIQIIKYANVRLLETLNNLKAIALLLLLLIGIKSLGATCGYYR